MLSRGVATIAIANRVIDAGIAKRRQSSFLMVNRWWWVSSILMGSVTRVALAKRATVIKIPITVLDGRLVKRVSVDVVVAELGVVAVVVSGASAKSVVVEGVSPHRFCLHFRSWNKKSSGKKSASCQAFDGC